MMFFNRSKKEKDEVPVVAKKPPVPPKRHKFFQIGSKSGEETVPPTISGPSELEGSTYSGINNQFQNSHSVYASPNWNFTKESSKSPPTTLSTLPVNEAGDWAAPASPSQPHAAAAFGALKEFDLPGLQLPALEAVQVRQRTLILQKAVTGDFGFSVRRVQFPFGGELKTVVFAEPSEIKAGPPRPDDIRNGLLPGDQLIQVNGLSVDHLSRDELQDVIRNASIEIELVVRSVPELAEFCDRHRGVRDTGDSLLLHDVDTNAHESIPEEERYWLMHKGGYTMARLREMQSDGRVAVTVAGRDMVVDSTDVDRVNPTHLDRTPDFAGLRYLNETSTVHLLRQRYGSNLPYTNAGSASLVCLTGESEPGVQERLLSLFKGCRRGQMPPHIYATAQHVYRNVQMTGNAQSVHFTGVTGSGKSTQLRHFVQYMATVAGWTRALPFSRLSYAFGVLEAFGHAATHLHRDSTRYVQMFQLGFDKAAALKSAKIQPCLLEADRVVCRPDGESSFHVFYYLWEGADDVLHDRLQLSTVDTPNIIPLKTAEDKEQAKSAWKCLLEAFRELGFSQEQVNAICSVLGAIFHLARAEATAGAAQRAHFLRANHAQCAAALLGMDVDQLSQAVFRGKTGGNAATSTVGTGSSISRFSMTSRGQEGPEALTSFTAALYNELFLTITDLINKGLAANAACTWVTLIDIPGANFNAAWSESRRRSFGLNELVYNYVNERVAELFHDKSFAEMNEVYTREQVDVEVEKPVGSPHALNRLLDQKQQLINCTDLERRSEERRGLLAILEEESVFPGATDESLLERIFMHLGDQTRLIRRASKPCQFVLAHGLDSHPTTYDVRGWVRHAQPSDSANNIRTSILTGKGTAVQSLFTPIGLTSSDSVLKLRRATQTAHIEQIGRRMGSGFASNISGQMDYVFSVVRRAPRSHFVHCIQPSVSLSSGSGLSYSMTSSMVSCQPSDSVDVPFVRNQLRSILLIDSVRANNRGYPERVSFRDFRRRFGCLVDDEITREHSIDDAIDDRAAVQKIMDKMDIHAHRYRLGISQVLLRSDVLIELEDRRDLSLSGLIVSFQRECRRHLANKWLARRRVLDTAIRCIQKNGLAYTQVREWPWWRLYTKVIPLLAVNRSDDEHREWSRKVQKLEQTLAEMRTNKVRLEDRIAELEESLGREADASHQLQLALESANAARVHAERRAVDDERMSRVSSVARLEYSMSDERVSELRRDVEKAKESEESMRVKTQKTVAQLQDVTAELNDVRARNEILEKKQSRFDTELRAVETQLESAVRAKERTEKERDEIVAQSQRRKADFETLKTENAELRTSVSRLRRDLEDVQEKGGPVDAIELAQLKKSKREVEQKLQDQEDELDELAGERQLLQQSVTRLEMQMERMRADSNRDTDARENEIEELRAQYQRRLRAFEDQIADLQDSNSSLTKENRAIEARMRNQDAQSVSWEMSGGHYKRELRRALALLADTQTILAHERESAPSQHLIRQLREQLEDAEAAKLAALKGRHSLDSELNELRAQIEQLLVAKSTAEDKVLVLLKEKNSGLAIIEEKDEQLQQLMKKYKAAIQQNHIDGITIADYVEQIADLEKAKQKLADELHERTSQLEFMSHHTVEKHRMLLAEQKMKELEAKLDLEQIMKLRLESNVLKLSDEVESLNEQFLESMAAKEREGENGRKIRKEMTTLQETIESLRKRDADIQHKYKAERTENEKLGELVRSLQAEQKLSQRRIESLQTALTECLGESDQDLSDIEEDLETNQSTLEEGHNGMNIL